jgi:hypothetical protein
MEFPLFTPTALRDFSHYALSDKTGSRLIVPRNRRLAGKGLAFFFPWYNRLRLSFQSYLVISLRQHFIETPLLRVVKEIAGGADLHVVLKYGSPGPYTKDTLLFMSEKGLPRAIAKVASTEAGTHLLKREAEWLSLLADNPEFRERVPSLIRATQLERVYLLIERPGGGVMGGTLLREHHLRFLSDFQAAFGVHSGFNGSCMNTTMEKRLGRLMPLLSPIWSARLQKATECIESGFKGVPLPMVAAHRDFTPWNILSSASGIFVFDWEYAENNYVPFYDLFHFVLLRQALSKNVPVSSIRMLLAKVMKEGRSLSDGESKCNVPDIQLLAYLTDLTLMYLDSIDGAEIQHNVLDNYGRLIDAFPQWKIS